MQEKSVETQRRSTAASRWERSYAGRLYFTDLTIVIAVVLSSQFIRFGGDQAKLQIPSSDGSGLGIAYTMVSALLIVGWMLSLGFFDTRDHKIIGSGSTEYKRVADSTIRLFGILAIIAFLAKAEIGRGYILLALPAGLVLLLLGRWGWRQWLVRKRNNGEYAHKAILLGHRGKTGPVAASIQRERASGLEIIGAVTPHGSTSRDLVENVPVLGAFEDVVRVLDQTEADVLVLTGADDIGARDMRQLGWDLERRGVDLVVAPALTDVAGPRIHSRPVAGLPLIYVDFPSLEGRRYIAKRALDLVMSALLLVIASPIFLLIAIAIKRDSSGPIFFSQERVGLNGTPFKMLKFRSMVTDAEALLPSILDRSEGNGVLFKMRDDPRITRIGRTLRKHSLDELPQLFNVLRGEMSLVGPRPPLVREVSEYDDWARRRLLVKPGITGLWQVNGRSSLSWSDSVRLDLYYVENWSMTSDLVILYRTLKEVVKSNHAY